MKLVVLCMEIPEWNVIRLHQLSNVVSVDGVAIDPESGAFGDVFRGETMESRTRDRLLRPKSNRQYRYASGTTWGACRPREWACPERVALAQSGIWRSDEMRWRGLKKPST